MTDQLAPGDLDDEAAASDDDSGASTDAALDLDEGVEQPDDDAVAPVGRRFGRRPRRQRVSRWDRPPEPRDWRFYVGNLGKILIATGLLMFGFVAYQLWGTGIETARAQNRLENEFDQLLAEFAADGVDTPPADGAEPAIDPTDEAVVLDDPVVADSADAPETDAGADEPAPADADTGEVPQAIPIAIDLSDEAVVQDPIPQPFRGDPLFRLEIPAIGRDDIVVAGVSLNDLKNGPGHYPDTPLPGQLGNAATAGHRTTYGAPFFDVDQLGAGDELITTLANGDRFVYEVTFVEVVEASDYWVVTTSDPTIAEFTLTSCHPKYTARDRIVVHSVLNPEKSSNVGFPTFYELEPDPDDAPIPGDDPVLVADEDIDAPDPAPGDADQTDEAADPVDEAADQPESAEPAADSPEAGDENDAPGAAGADDTDESQPAAVSEPTPVDAFSQGWFEDAAAFPQIALWGLALALISFLAYQLSKRFRRYSVGILAGFLPFLVALYFFYQNINRLLPPGI